MAGMNSRYNLGLKTELYMKLKAEANERGLFLSELLREILGNYFKTEKIRDIVLRTEKKVDLILKDI